MKKRIFSLFVAILLVLTLGFTAFAATPKIFTIKPLATVNEKEVATFWCVFINLNEDSQSISEYSEGVEVKVMQNTHSAPCKIVTTPSNEIMNRKIEKDKSIELIYQVELWTDGEFTVTITFGNGEEFTKTFSRGNIIDIEETTESTTKQEYIYDPVFSTKPNETETTTEEISTEEVIYSTPNGKKYHNQKCCDGEFTECSLEKAFEAGLKPCEVCFPDGDERYEKYLKDKETETNSTTTTTTTISAPVEEEEVPHTGSTTPIAVFAMLTCAAGAVYVCNKKKEN